MSNHRDTAEKIAATDWLVGIKAVSRGRVIWQLLGLLFLT